jgi:hypothetical protein
MNAKSNRGLVGLVLGLLALCVPTLRAQGLKRDELKTLLSKQGFTGELTGNIKFENLGEIGCGQRQIEAIYYEWNETQSPGLAMHQSHRILFISKQQQYLGSYAIDERPAKLSPLSILFNYDANSGNTIKCTSDGLPKTVLLDGDLKHLAN